MSVPAIRAAREAGRNFLSCSGQRIPTPSATAAIANAWKLTSFIASGQDWTAPNGPPCAMDAPRNGKVCKSMMIMPMPDMKPDMTE